MTLKDLKDQIDTLCEYYEDGGVGTGAIKVKVGVQRNYPLRANLVNICTEHKTDNDKDDVIWLAIGDGIDYGVPTGIWDDSDVYPNEER